MRKWWYIASLQDTFFVGLWNASNLWISLKLLYFKTQIATFVGISEKLLPFEIQVLNLWEHLKIATFFTESAMFPGKSTGLQWVYCEIGVDSYCDFFFCDYFFPSNTMVSSSTILIKVKSGRLQNSMY